MPDTLLPIFTSGTAEPKPKEDPAAVEKKAEPVVQQARPVKRGSIRKLRGLDSPSIKDALEGKFKDEETKISAKEQFKMHTRVEEEDPFSKEDLEGTWKSFLKRLDDRPNLKSTLSRIPELKEDYLLFLEIDNTIQEEIINSIKPELVSYLRKSLKNSKIEFKTQVSERIKNRVIYTDQDKFEELAKKNPSLKSLKQKFNLDFGEV